MISLSVEEFAPRRRTEQHEIELFLRPYVRDALNTMKNTGGYSELISAIRAAWVKFYATTSETEKWQPDHNFIRAVEDTLRKTDRANSTVNTVNRITTWLATAVIGHASHTAAENDPEDFLLEWVDMNDERVRHTHADADGQRIKPGERFSVGGEKMPYPGYPGVSIELWINCRCSLRIVPAQEALVASNTDDGYEGVTHAGLAVQASDTGRVLMIQRSLDQEDPPDVQGTWEFPGGGMEGTETPEEAARREFAEEVGCAVPEGEITGGWRSEDGIYQGFVLTTPLEREAFPNGHNLTEPEVANPDDPQRRKPDVSAWFSLQQIQELGCNLRPECHNTDWSQFSEGGGDVWHSESDDKEAAMPEDNTDEALTAATGDALIPWHGVLTVEGKRSGDGRKFAPNSLRTRPLPLPLSWQEKSAAGHDEAYTVARIDREVRVPMGDGTFEIRAHGSMLSNEHADKVVGLLGEFGRFGVSIDADDATASIDEDSGEMVFTDSRSAGSCIVAIPAFHEAWVALGEMPADFYDDGTDLEAEHGAADESLVAATGASLLDVFVDIAPGKTEDGPGWLTHPVDTDRLRDYWTKGEGAAEIDWGVPGDFNRCRLRLAEYIKPEYLSGYCANRHYDALGVWPGQELSAAETLEMTNESAAPMLTLVASRYGALKANHDWFYVPEGEKDTPFTITDEGQVFGWVAQWDVCHGNTGEYGECMLAPRSPSNYANFHLGYVETDQGKVDVGCLTIGGGHANGRLRLKDAQRHYDDTTAAWADVRAIDGEHGIWVSGWVRPGTPEEMVIAARASKLSGDWRRTAAGLDMIAALCVNSPGFIIPRVAASFDGMECMSLVAAGVPSFETMQVAEMDLDALAEAVTVKVLEAQQRREALNILATEFRVDPVAAMKDLAAEFQGV